MSAGRRRRLPAAARACCCRAARRICATPAGTRRSACSTCSARGRSMLFMIGAGFCQSSHAVLYSFGTLTWRSAGLDDVTISLLWGESVAVEILMMMGSGWLMKRIGVTGLIGARPRLRHRALDRHGLHHGAAGAGRAAGAARRHLRRLPSRRHGLHPARPAQHRRGARPEHLLRARHRGDAGGDLPVRRPALCPLSASTPSSA